MFIAEALEGLEIPDQELVLIDENMNSLGTLHEAKERVKGAKSCVRDDLVHCVVSMCQGLDSRKLVKDTIKRVFLAAHGTECEERNSRSIMSYDKLLERTFVHVLSIASVIQQRKETCARREVSSSRMKKKKWH